MLLSNDVSLISMYLFTSELTEWGEIPYIKVVSKRNYNLCVFFKNKQFLLKQLKYNDFENIEIFKNEFTITKTLKTEEVYAGFSRFLPNVYFFDPRYNIICSEWISESNDLKKTIALKNQKQFFDVGKIIRKLHKLPNNQVFREDKPWIFKDNKNFNMIIKKNNFSRDYLYLLDDIKIQEEIQYCKKLWQFNALNHGDLKLENILHQRNNDKYYFIDWEFGCFGDAYWDIAHLLSDIILTFLLQKKYVVFDLSLNNYNVFSNEVVLKKVIYQLLMGYSDAQQPLNKIKIIKYTGFAMIKRLFELSNHNELNQKGFELILLAKKMILNSNMYYNNFSI